MPSIFYIGATGYIGGSVLVPLINRYSDWKINALVRNKKDFASIRELGATVVEGSFADAALIAEQSRVADIVINTADADDFPLTTAILTGLKQRFDEGKSKGALIHTSGCAIFLNDKKDGKLDPNCKAWNDTNEEDFKSLTTSQLHGQVDVPILQAGEEGYVNTYILCPSGVIGATPAGVPVKNGTLFLKIIAQAYIEAKEGFYVGEGTNEFHVVHIEDLVDYYLRVIDFAVNGKDVGASPYERYFIVTAATTNWKMVAQTVSQDLYRRSLLKSSVPKSVALSEVHPWLSWISADERPVAGRGEGLGWKPRHGGLQQYIKESMDEVLEGVKISGRYDETTRAFQNVLS
ncbi:hypothetical protein OF83DRAFT_613776 [Amylostereum chailletii]|nr:hypothetical protein OF83DRAFT_613776 [Amylostereum chailletii]